jgi:hypothetical protein
VLCTLYLAILSTASVSNTIHDKFGYAGLVISGLTKCVVYFIPIVTFKVDNDSCIFELGTDIKYYFRKDISKIVRLFCHNWVLCQKI